MFKPAIYTMMEGLEIPRYSPQYEPRGASAKYQGPTFSAPNFPGFDPDHFAGLRSIYLLSHHPNIQF